MPLPCSHSWHLPPVVDCVHCRIRHLHAERWGGEPIPEPGECIHLGALTGETRDKYLCQADPPTQVSLRLCDVHGRCTTDLRAKETKRCKDCSEREINRFAPVRRRHLVYHLLPVADHSAWRRGVDELRRRWHLFTGRKIVSVATGHEPIAQGSQTARSLQLDPPEVVRAYLPRDAEVIEVPNNPDRWELSSWPQLWETVLKGAHADDAVLYCHAKGVTRPDRIDEVTQGWARLLYSLCLDHWPLVANLLRRTPIVGPLKKQIGVGLGMLDGAWHYSGNFWWVRAGQFRWPATPVIDHPWGTEAWPGNAYNSREGGTIFSVPGIESREIYQAETWNDVILAAYARWLANHRPGNTFEVNDPPTFSIIVPTSGRDTINRTLASITPQLKAGDELIIERDDTGDWGATPRRKGMDRARGDYLLFMDDDDVYTAGALDTIRAALKVNPGKPHIFKMRRPWDELWQDREVRLGNVSTQMVVVPNDTGKLGMWGLRYAGDFDFIESTIRLYPAGSVIWREEVIAEWRA